MNLHEFQAKRLFAEHGITIPHGEVAYTPEKAREIAAELGGKAVVKAQVLTGGRGKAGGIKLAKTPAEAEAHASAIRSFGSGSFGSRGRRRGGTAGEQRHDDEHAEQRHQQILVAHVFSPFG